jgi:hypothetical protein
MLAEQEAADSRMLGQAPFRALNMGLVITGLAHVITLMPWWNPCNAGPYMPYMVGLWAAVAGAGALGFLSQPQPQA